jgi:hypothetical protein
VVAGAGPRDRLLARLRAGSVDAAIADGRPTDSNRVTAIRASALVAPGNRESLAHYWENVLARAGRPHTVADPRLPVVRDEVLAAAEDITELAGALRRRGPVPARGVALASRLLTDGTGPVYSRRSRVNLAAAVRDAVRWLDPESEFASR